jgi:nitrogenase molybdenum-cofactor synthesis protein NifE
MLHYQAEGPAVTMTIGKDAGYYHPECPGVQWNQDIQPFGHDGVRRLFDALYRAAEEGSRDSFESTIVLGTGAAVPKKESSALLEAPACKGLRRHLTPFAPDQSGAVSVLYEMGGIIVICDAGGCAGNICGFDEPRWFGEKSAVFSAGLRDMDAILGRDEKLVEKLKKAADQVPASFAAIIGTPVPAVIGTDFRALERMSEKATGLTILSIDTDGMHWYDRGAEKAFEALFKTFCRDRNEDPEQYKDSKQNDHQIQNDPSALYAGTPKIGVLGATPLDLNDTKAADRLRRKILEETGKTAVCYGMGASLEDVRRAAGVSENLVVSPAGLSTAVWMEKKFGIPYRADLPLAEEYLPEEDLSGKKILVVHQQVMADSLRRRLEAKGAAHVDCATWFMLKKELGRQEDIQLKEEEDFTDLVREGGYDLILADQALRPLVPDYQGAWIHVPHFAVSGS